MAEYVCKVGDTAGRVFQQVETAQSEAEVRQKLADRGYYVFSVRAHLGLFSQLAASRKPGELRGSDFLMFNQQFNTLIKAGLPILKALDLLADRAAAPRLRPVLQDVRKQVRDGAMLSEAIQAEGVFPGVYTTALVAGEKSGNLSGVLEHYIAYQRVSTSFRSRLVTTLIYPAILVTVSVLILTYLVTYAIPQFANLYSQLGVPLPWLTTVVLAIALPLRTYFLWVVGILAGGVLFLLLWLRTDSGALAVDRVKPQVPLFGDIWLKAQVAQLVRTLSTLLAGGTPLVPALETSAGAIGSRLISKSVFQAAGRVREGQSLAASLMETKLFPVLALDMVEVGEASGALAPMLNSVAEFYEEEVNTRLTRLLTYIQPAILLVMAFMVAFILISLYLPMFSLAPGAAPG